jgi:hypothetical protein
MEVDEMRQVIIGINKDGEPYVVSAPNKLQVVIRPDKAPTFRKLLRKVMYRIRYTFGGI